MTRQTTPFLMTLLATSPAMAQMYKCTDPATGRVTFSQMQCATEAHSDPEYAKAHIMEFARQIRSMIDRGRQMDRDDDARCGSSMRLFQLQSDNLRRDIESSRRGPHFGDLVSSVSLLRSCVSCAPWALKDCDLSEAALAPLHGGSSIQATREVEAKWSRKQATQGGR